ncbi:MAG TPA: hypothetical protein VE988_26615 [Gemmataceae bacterium]|nr:hypothetical protein [Gemmataceae bacterium]
MTEAEWLTCTDPQAMLEFLKGKTSDRKLRLFAVACCRRVWQVLTDERTRTIVDISEKYADGVVSNAQLQQAHNDACEAASTAIGPAALYAATFCGTNLSYNDAGLSASNCSLFAAQSISNTWDASPDAQERHAQSVLFHDIFGNSFRPVPITRTWQTPLVVALAHAAYEERALPSGVLDLARLAVLADALEEAGCTNPDILNHCRDEGPHVRGCWVVDLLLGKE